MNLSLLVADPFPVELWQRQDRFADVPSLALLLARGTCRTLPWRGAEAWAFETLTGRPATEAPLAALSLLADGGNPGDALWVRADPVHLALTRDSASCWASPGSWTHKLIWCGVRARVRARAKAVPQLPPPTMAIFFTIGPSSWHAG